MLAPRIIAGEKTRLSKFKHFIKNFPWKISGSDNMIDTYSLYYIYTVHNLTQNPHKEANHRGGLFCW